MMSDSRFSSDLSVQALLSLPITPEHWSLLEIYMKQVAEYMAKCTKSRQYMEAQRGKDKMEQLHNALKERNICQVDSKLQASLRELSAKQEEEGRKFEREWDTRCNKVVKEYESEQAKKQERHRDQMERHIKQLQIAVPLTHSPDTELHKLKWQQSQYASEGKFLEAQEIVNKIERREAQQAQRYKTIRENNISAMLVELRVKQENEILLLSKRKSDKLMEIEAERKRKAKDLTDKFAREEKELRWVYNEESKRYR